MNAAKLDIREIGALSMPLTDKARAALARRFNVGIVREGDTPYADVVGAAAMDFEMEVTPGPGETGPAAAQRALNAFAGRINALVERGLVVGTRSGPDVIRERGKAATKVCMRVMIAPGKNEEAQRLVHGS